MNDEGSDKMRIPEAIITEIVNKSDIVQYVAKYVSLEKRGRNHFGCCPFHEENTPSFSVSEVKHIFHCFGCHEGGGILQFIMKYHHLSFLDALFLLAEEIGYDLSAYKQSQYVKQQSPAEKLYYDTFKEVQELYAYLLTTTSGKEAQSYLTSRGIDAQVQKEFGIGYAPITSVLKTHFDSKQLSLSGAYEGSLVRDNETTTYDFFRNRVTFPIKDTNGRVIAYTARKLPSDTNESSPKYLNSAETTYFKKGELLYHFDIAKTYAKSERRIFIFEGITDVIAAYQNGIKNSVAVLGTALTEYHARMLSRLKVQVVLCFDGDGAGLKATMKSGDILLQHHIQTTIMQLPDGLDPDGYFQQYTKADFQLLQNSALDFIIYKAHKLKEQFILSQLSDQKKYLDTLFQSIMTYSDQSDQHYFLDQIATISALDVDRVMQRFNEVTRGESQAQRRVPQPSKHIFESNQEQRIEEKMLRIVFEGKAQCDLFTAKKGYFPTAHFQEAYRFLLEYRMQFPEVDTVDFNHFFSIFEIRKEIQALILDMMMRTIIDLRDDDDRMQFINRYMQKLKHDDFKAQKAYNLQSETITLEQINHLIQLKKELIKE